MSLNNVSQANNREIYANSIHSNLPIIVNNIPESFSVTNTTQQLLDPVDGGIIAFPEASVPSSNFGIIANTYTIPAAGYYMFWVAVDYLYDVNASTVFSLNTILFKNGSFALSQCEIRPPGTQNAGFGGKFIFPTNLFSYDHFVAGDKLTVVCSAPQFTLGSSLNSLSVTDTQCDWMGVQVSVDA